MSRPWTIVLLILAAPVCLWLLALAGWVLMLLFDALYHGVMLILAFLITVVFR